MGIDEKDFIDLVQETDDFKYSVKETQLKKKYEENGVDKKQFDKMVKSCKKRYGQKIAFNNQIMLPKNKYELELDAGTYICSETSIRDKEYNIICYHPIIPVEIYINKATGNEKVKIAFYKNKRWHEKIVDKTDITIAGRIMQLANCGVEVTSETAKSLVKYLSEILNLNIEKFEVKSSISNIGWDGDNFLPYNNADLFDGADEFKNVYKSICEKGDYKKWLETTQGLRNKSTALKIIMATTLASPLLEKLDLQPYMVNVWSGESGSGKTLSSMIAMSIWGNPDAGCLQFSSNNTQNFYSVVAAFMRNITCYFDELQIIKKNKYFDMESLVMDLCNRTERGRLNKNSEIREIKTWHCNFLFTSNDRLVKENAGEQVYNRVIDIETDGKIIENGNKIANIIKNNYGFAGKLYIEHVKNVGFDEIRNRYDEIFVKILAETNSTDKQASAIASLLVADTLINEVLFKDDTELSLEDLKPYINDKNKIKTYMKAYEYLIGTINANVKRFDSFSYSEIWGSKDEFVCTINKQILLRELKKGGYEYDTIKKDWYNNDLIEKNSQNRYSIQTTVNSERGNYVQIKMPQNEQN